MKKIINTGMGFKVIATDDINDVVGLDAPFVGDYDRKVAEAQMDTCGYYIIDYNTGMVIDNEEDLSLIYQKIKKHDK